jgi:uroporphyrinogen III methyltransferase/synthase
MRIRIGCRESRLAVIQAEIAAELLRARLFEIEIVTMQTSGDRLKDKPLDGAGGKGLFTRELDAALLEGRIDMAVHSLKDVPALLPAGLVISAFCAAGDPRDALVLPKGAAEFDAAKPMGCAAKRRSIQLAALYPGIRCALVRGNVPTRLAKLDAGEYGALTLALAGLKRLGLEDRASRIFTIEELLPAAGQGVLAVVTRAEGDAAQAAENIDDPVSRRRALAERAFTRMLDGGCGLPVAAFARDDGGCLVLEGRYCPEGETTMIGEVLRGDPANPEALGRRLAFRLLAAAARRRGCLGNVELVGAGPGDAGLLTLRAEAVLAGAEVVVFDKLAGPGVIAKIPIRAEKIYAGKESGRHDLPQEEINAILVKKAAAGLRVVRLKGGDPLLFGRGSEEALCLADAGVPWEIIPGVSSIVAVPGSAGIPLTHRGVSSRLHIIAAHGAKPEEPDYPGLAQLCTAGGALVFLMGASRLNRICRSLVEAGLPGNTPAAVVSQGTTAKQTQVIATTATLADRAAEAGIVPPALILVGEVCRLAEALAVCKKPLAGVRIAVTRPRLRAGEVNRLARMLDAQGAEVIELPVIEIVPMAETPLLQETLAALPAAPSKTWFAFTSVHGVETFFQKLVEYRIDIRTLAGCKFAAVGNATCEALACRGIIASLVPETFSGAALGAALVEKLGKDETVVLPRSAIGGKELPDALDAAGLRCIDIPVYDTIPVAGFENPSFRARLIAGLNYAAFTSPSAVESFAAIFGVPSIGALCIGEATAALARVRGMEAIVPQTPTLEGMVEALIKRLSSLNSRQSVKKM